MFSNRWRLFRAFGIPIYIDASWLIILLLLTWTLTHLYSSEQLALTPAAYWLMSLATVLTFFACIILHELGHALVAQRSGMPVRGITLFLFGGVAELEGEPPSARKEFWMAIAGPIVSLVLAAGFFAAFAISRVLAWPGALQVFLGYLGWINAAVLIFNMVPAFPLDGGRVLRSILWATTGSLNKATRWASWTGQGFAWVLIGLGLVSLIGGNLLGGIWLGLIGLFLNGAARSSYQAVLVRQALRGESIARFMNPNPITVSPDLHLRSWVEEFVYVHHHKSYPVLDGGRLIGVVTTRMLSEFPRDQWDFHTVGEVMKQDIGKLCIPPHTDALEAFERIQKTGSSRLFVTEGDHLVGIISLKDLVRFLQLKLELEGEEDQELPPEVRRVETREETPVHS
jgi:Zn-dependent protease/CBS domain-containing protein